MAYLNITTIDSNEETSIEERDEGKASKLVNANLTTFMNALRRIENKSVDNLIINNHFTEDLREKLFDAMYKDYHLGTEQKIKFEFGQSPVIPASNGKNSILEIEVTPQNIAAIAKLMNDAATKPRDTDDNKKISEEILGEFRSGLENIANLPRPNFTRAITLL